MRLSTPQADAVLAGYAQRLAEEDARVAALGSAAMAHRDEMLLAVGPEVGWFLHSLVLAKRPARVLELGTSYGYSTLFFADAVKQIGGRLITMDVAADKQAYARARLDEAGLADVVEFRCGDAVAMVADDPGPFDLVLIDIWKELYPACLEAVYPKLADEGIIASDNMIEPAMWRETIRAYRASIAALPDMTTCLLPIGNGIELSVKWREGNSKT